MVEKWFVEPEYQKPTNSLNSYYTDFVWPEIADIAFPHKQTSLFWYWGMTSGTCLKYHKMGYKYNFFQIIQKDKLE